MKRKEPIELPEGWKFVEPCKWFWKGPKKVLPKHKLKDWEDEIVRRKDKLLESLKGKTYRERSHTIRQEGAWTRAHINRTFSSKSYLFEDYDRYLAALHTEDKRTYLDLFLKDYTKSLYFPDSKKIELHVSTEPKEKPLRFEPKELFDQQGQLAQREMDKAAAMGSDLNSVLAYWKEEWNNWKIRSWVYGDLLDTLNKHLAALEGQFEAISSKQKGASAQSETQADKQSKTPPNNELWEKFFEWLRGEKKSRANLFLLFCRITGYDYQKERERWGNRLMEDKLGLESLFEINRNERNVHRRIDTLDNLGENLVSGITGKTVKRLLEILKEDSPLKDDKNYVAKIDSLLSKRLK